MNDYVPLWAFLSVLIPAVIGPLVLAWIRRSDRKQEARIRKAEKQEDWKRQDEVAKRVKEAAVQVAGAADLLLVSNATVAKAAEANSEEIAEIHHLVDGQMTIAMQESLDSKITSLVLMREVVELKLARGVEPSQPTRTTIETLERQISELSHTISERQSLVKAAEDKREVNFMPAPTEGTQ